MHLLVDPSRKDEIRLVLFDAEQAVEKVVAGKNNETLAAIDAFLSERGVASGDVAGIAVVVGVGGFTSTRVATTIANAFGYVHQTPLLAVTAEQGEHPCALAPVFSSSAGKGYISAVYSGEPNIGK